MSDQTIKLTTETIDWLKRAVKENVLKNEGYSNLLQAASQSPFFAGQLNSAAVKNIEFSNKSSSGSNLSGTYLDGKLLVIGSGIDQSIYSDFVSAIAHELGHATLPGGQNVIGSVTYPEEAVASGLVNEGVALTAEYIVAKQLGFTMTSDSPQSATIPSITAQLDTIANNNNIDINTLQFGLPAANAFTDVRSDAVVSAALWSGSVSPSIAEHINYSQYYADWKIINLCYDSSDWGMINQDNINWQQMQPSNWHSTTTSDGYLLYSVPNIPLNNGGMASVSVTLDQGKLLATEIYLDAVANTNGGTAQKASLVVNLDGSKSELIQNFNIFGAVQNEQVINTTKTGSVSATLSGTGVVINLNNAEVTVKSGTSATVVGGMNNFLQERNSLLLDVDESTSTIRHDSIFINPDGDYLKDLRITDLIGNVLQEQVAQSNSKTNLTTVANYSNGALIATGVIQGLASKSQLEEEAELAAGISQITSLGQLGNPESGSSILNPMGVTNSAMLQSALQEADQNVADGNDNSNSGPEDGESYLAWLNERANDGSAIFADTASRIVTTITDLLANPGTLPLEDGALAVSMAQQHADPVSVLVALQKVLLAGTTLSDVFKENMATMLGATPETVNKLLLDNGTALIAIVNGFQNPTPTSIATALLQTMKADFPISADMRNAVKQTLGIEDATLTELMAYGGAGLAVVSAMKDPTPQNIVNASAQTTSLIAKLSENPAQFAQLSNALSSVNLALNIYDFAKNPNPQTAVSTMLAVGMKLAPQITLPIAAVLTIAQAIIPGPTESVINGLYGIASTIWNGISSAGRAIFRTIGIGPLVISLEGLDVHTTVWTADSPRFDILDSNVRLSTAWITPDEGFLVRDLNGNGQIDSIRELFSEFNSTSGKSAFGTLAELDSNNNQRIDISDSAWNSLKIWVDKNSDGISQSNELYTLAQLGIASIDLNVKHGFTYDNGNIIGDTSTFTRNDGSKGQIADAMLTYQDKDGTAIDTSNQIVMGSEGTTVRLSNGATAQFVTGNNQNINVSNRGIDLVVSQGGNNTITAGNTEGVVIVGGAGDQLNAGKGENTTLVGNGGATLTGNENTTQFL
ncbi:MAG: hypothetical protein HQM05_17260, partial [Magnetococcales bacterium]|nr:hypothetical protein [Magnetococcales bacterium]